MEQSLTPNVFTLQIDSGNTAYLTEAARWAKFLAIMGFVFCGLIAIAAFFAGSLLSDFSQLTTGDTGANLGAVSGTFLTVYYVVVAVLYFVPSLYLFNFASKMQTALRNNDQMNLNTSFRNLKACFKFWGILFIIALSFIAIVIIVAVIGAGLS